MRRILSVICVLGLMTAVWADDEKKEVTLKGAVTCGKCELKKTDSCHAVIVVKDGDKEEVYYFDKDSNEKHGKDCCESRKNATVVGTVKEKDGKKVIAVTKITIEKKE
jgi:hypothetical protein